MTTELIEPKTPIRVDIVQKQYRNGMKLEELALLYEVDPLVLEPLVKGLPRKERKHSPLEKKPHEYTKAELEGILETDNTITAFRSHVGCHTTEEAQALLARHDLLHHIKTKDQLLEEKYSDIIHLLDEGVPRKEIESKLGVTSSKISLAVRYFKRDDLKKTAKKGMDKIEREVLAAKILERVQDKTVKEIMSELGINRNTYDGIRREYKLPSAKRPPKNQQWNEKPFGKSAKPGAKRTRKPLHDYEQLARRVEALRAKGMTNSEIIEELNICNATYYKVKALHGKDWPSSKRGRKKESPKPPTEKPKEEPTVKATTADLESAVTAFKPEEVPEVIGAHYEHKKPSARVINRDKDVWGEYLSARSEDIADVTHETEIVKEGGKLIERTTLSYTLERELGR